MTTWIKGLVGAAALAAAVGAGYWFGARGHGGASKPAANAAPEGAQSAALVPVQTAQVAVRSITETVTVYGKVVAQPGAIRAISVPFEANVVHVLATLGEPVRPGAPLVRIAPSPSTQLQLQQARTAAEAAARKLAQVRQEYDAHLAVTTQLIDAEKAASAAELQLSQLEKEGAGAARTIRADAAGTVSEIAVHDGQLVQAGAPLLSLVVQNRLEASLGVEPEDARYVRAGNRIDLNPVNTATRGSVSARVLTVASQVNPKTQLIDVQASLPRGSGLLLGAYVQGKVVTAAQTGLVAPKSAVLPTGAKYKLFTVAHGRAVEHLVSIGVANDTEVQVLDAGLKPGDLVVTQGNYELSDGMPVQIRSGS